VFIAGESTLRLAVALVMSLIPRDVSNDVLDVVAAAGVAVVAFEVEGKYIELRRKAFSENSPTGRNWVSACR